MKSILKIIISTSMSVLAIANQAPAACLPKSGHSVRCLKSLYPNDTIKIDYSLPEEVNSTAGNNFLFNVCKVS